MASDKARFSNQINIRNKRASFEFEILDKYVSGLVLRGTEIKSIREGKVNLQDGYCYFHGNELFVKGVQISPYAQGSYYNHEVGRERKLLLKRSELNKLRAKVEEKGLTLVPLRLFLTDRGLAKMEIALARGKKLYDKRESIKDRETKRELARLK
ncbi:MAG: SsrA-binding protein SmpB [Cyclobacteriaceae bacterium]|jgi:SsrA-binding protein|nr:SsrA-binding protein SmpB [Flammeovirgaceae bacterium]